MKDFEVVVDVLLVEELIADVEVPLDSVLVMVVLVLVKLVVENTEPKIRCVILIYNTLFTYIK